MAIAPSGFIIKPPKCTDGPDYGLLSAVQPITSNDPHWMASGIQWEDFLCGPPPSAFIDECPPASYTKPAEDSSNFCHADPFLAIGSYKCPPVGRDSGEAFEIARQRLLNWEGYQVEKVLWTGQGANGPVNPSFAFGNPDCGILPEDILPGGATDPVTAIAYLENRLGQSLACGGTIHVPYGLLTYLQASRLLTERDGAYYTATGARIVAGHGYDGSGPGGVAAAAGETWIYGTGPVILVNSNVMMVPGSIAEAVDRRINDVTVRAERFYAVGFSCVLLALRVKLTCGCC